MTDKVKQALGTIRSFGGASLERGIEPSVGRADSGRIEVDFEEVIEDLVPALKEKGVVPAQRRGAVYDGDAARMIVRSSGGYPYYLQTYGQAAWELALDRRITEDDAAAAIQRGNEELDMGFFSARWDRATPSERNYLVAMAEDAGTPSQTPELASRLGTRPQSLSPVRQSLIGKGIIYVPDRGLVAFTVPNMHDFVQRQVQD